MRATIFKLIAAVFVSLSAGLIGSLFTAGGDFASWYDALEKPSFTPANWVFGPVWTALYVLMGVAAFLVWQRGFRTDGSESTGFFLDGSPEIFYHSGWITDDEQDWGSSRIFFGNSLLPCTGTGEPGMFLRLCPDGS